MHDVTCLGELLIDFTAMEADLSLAECPGFYKHAGGAPANVAVGVSRLGGSAAFLGMVGQDGFGAYLAEQLASRGVDIRGLRRTTLANTTLAFVALRADGEREFVFYRNPGADMLYGPADIDEDLVANSRIFHHGTISFISAPNREATLRAIDIARANRRLISFDPNLRLNLWDDPLAAQEAIVLGLTTADIVKVSEEELEFITLQTDLQTGLGVLRDRGVPVVIATLGAEGCAYAWGSHYGKVAGLPVEAVDTTGAGDAFVAALLTRIVRADISPFDFAKEEIEEALAFANRVAGRVVTRPGAIPAMPTMEELAF